MEWHVWCTFQNKKLISVSCDLSCFFRRFGPGCGTIQLIQPESWGEISAVSSPKVMLTFARVSIFTAFIQLMSHSKVRPRTVGFCSIVFFDDFFGKFFLANLFVRQLGLWFNSLFTSVLLKSSELSNTQLQDFTIKFSKLSMLGCLAAWLLPRWAHQKLKNLQDQGVVLTPECIFVAAVGWDEHGHIQIPLV